MPSLSRAEPSYLRLALKFQRQIQLSWHNQLSLSSSDSATFVFRSDSEGKQTTTTGHTTSTESVSLAVPVQQTDARLTGRPSNWPPYLSRLAARQAPCWSRCRAARSEESRLARACRPNEGTIITGIIMKWESPNCGERTASRGPKSLCCEPNRATNESASNHPGALYKYI